ncbi:nitroreductase family protein [Secundilactobacillus folii]|uniref:NADPH-dependent oxidoreductase n=1 Tax=Secundilactobacillus folii TaxID=2678357 RepID=A0A7X2XWA7_9LACO|nr:nitroreductase family protein [Secundilactobacillus folii]MTV82853.1 NADPH-dependent oxidoreductase [Secundilactobacillus folii]
MSEDILSVLNHHRSVRQFDGQSLTNAEVTTLVTAAQHAATSTFSQQYSIISITDQDLKHEIGEITGHHWVENSGHYFLMIADQHRNLAIAQAANADTSVLRSFDKFMASVFDAAIATEAIVTAGEAIGLGSTIMGSILNNTQRLIDLLHLPELTFPLLGIAVGHPAEKPDLKPRLPQALMHFTNQYIWPDDFAVELERYNATTADYYASRNSNLKQMTFSRHIIGELSRDPNLRAELVQVIKQQGFNLD